MFFLGIDSKIFIEFYLLTICFILLNVILTLFFRMWICCQLAALTFSQYWIQTYLFQNSYFNRDMNVFEYIQRGLLACGSGATLQTTTDYYRHLITFLVLKDWYIKPYYYSSEVCGVVFKLVPLPQVRSPLSE